MQLWSKGREAERGTGMRECSYGTKRGKQRGVQGRVTPVREHRDGGERDAEATEFGYGALGMQVERGACKSKCSYGA